MYVGNITILPFGYISRWHGPLFDIAGAMVLPAGLKPSGKVISNCHALRSLSLMISMETLTIPEIFFQIEP